MSPWNLEHSGNSQKKDNSYFYYDYHSMIFDSKRDTEYEIGLFLFEMYHRDWEKNHTEVKGGI